MAFRWRGQRPARRRSRFIRGLGAAPASRIGYEPATGTFPWTGCPSVAGVPIPYRWGIDGDELAITTDLTGATFRGRWSEDGRTFSGGWRPMPGRDGPGNLAQDIWGAGLRLPTAPASQARIRWTPPSS